MNELIYTTGVISFIIQIITTIVDTYALIIPVSPSLIVIKNLLIIEYIVNFIEGAFYIWMIHNFSKIKNITITRYYDWVITTPLMLFTYSLYLLYTKNLEENKNHKLFKLINDEKYVLITIILLDLLMLFFGYIGELGKININLSTFLGFIPFTIMFYIIYENYSKYSYIGLTTFYYLLFIWGLYGISALMSYEVKNIIYNILDLFSKNFFALFLAYLLIYKNLYNR
jgi:hypothetical protein